MHQKGGKQMSREMRIAFKCQTGGGRRGSEYLLTSRDQCSVELPSEVDLNGIFQGIICSEPKINNSCQELKVLETFSYGWRIWFPGGYPAWIYTRFCNAVSQVAT